MERRNLLKSGASVIMVCVAILIGGCESIADYYGVGSQKVWYKTGVTLQQAEIDRDEVVRSTLLTAPFGSTTSDALWVIERALGDRGYREIKMNEIPPGVIVARDRDNDAGFVMAGTLRR